MSLSLQAVNTILYTDRFDECRSFYQAMPGFAVNVSMDWFVEFRAGPAFVSIAQASRTRIDAGDGTGLTLTFRVDDADVAHRALREAGFTPDEPGDHAWGARTFYLYDPDGRRIEFWSSLEA